MPYIYWSGGAKATKLIQKSFGSPYNDPFSGNRVMWDSAFDKDRWYRFMKSEVVVVSATWGGNKRKNNLKQLIGDKRFTKIKGNLSYLIRSAIIDEFNTELVEKAKEYNKKIIVIESSTLSRCYFNKNPNHTHKSHFRMMENHWTYGLGKIVDPIPDLDVGIKTYKDVSFHDHQWKFNEKGSIYVLGGLEWDPTSTLEVDEYFDKTVEEIRKVTNRKIVLRPHPESFLNLSHLLQNYDNIEICKPGKRLQEIYADAFSVVIDNSTSCFEVLEAGIPVFCSTESFASPLKNLDVSSIENPYLASKEEMYNWADKMAYSEFSFENKNAYLKYFESMIT